MKKLISIALTLLLLVSSTGLTYAQHFCGEFKMMETFALGEVHLSCGMVLDSSSCGEEKTEDHDCCDNQFTTVSIDDNYATAALDFHIAPQFIPSFVIVFNVTPLLGFESEPIVEKPYDPPPIIKDVLVLYDTFLI